MLTQARVAASTSSTWLKSDGTLRFLQSRVLVAKDGIALRETGRGELVVWLIFADWLQRLARLFSCDFCARFAPGHVLGESQFLRESAFFQFRTKVVLRDSRL